MTLHSLYSVFLHCAQVLAVDLSTTSRLGVLPSIAIPRPPPAPLAPGAGKVCKKPHLGDLCGKEAIGAIIGIAVGGTLLLGIVIGIIAFSFGRVSARPGACDTKQTEPLRMPAHLCCS